MGPGLMGLLASADGMGTLIGALLLAAVGKLPAHGRIFALGALLELVCLLGFAASPWYALSCVLLFGVGLGNAGFSAMQNTIILLSAAPGMRGRAVSVLGLCIGSTPLGLLELGALSAAVGAPAAIGINAAIGLALWLPVIAFTPLLSRPQEPGSETFFSRDKGGLAEKRTGDLIGLARKHRGDQRGKSEWPVSNVV